MRRRRGIAARVLLLALAAAAPAAPAGEPVRIPGGQFRSVIPQQAGTGLVTVDDFYLDDAPVTNGEFLRFVLHDPQWQRGRVVALFTDENYLAHWAEPVNLGQSGADQPVTQVSWFAARAYCESRDARLPSWYEWEYAAAADATVADARDRASWRQEMLSWYARTGTALADVRTRPANYFSIYDLHGLVWEWAEDFSGLLVSADNREQGGADALQFCGAGALSMEQKENYAVLMRVAMLSALEARSTTRNLGFRCARAVEAQP